MYTIDKYLRGQNMYTIYNNIHQWTKICGLYQALVASTNLDYPKRQCMVKLFTR